MTLFTVSYAENFLHVIARHLLSKSAHDPLHLKDYTIILPSERACSHLEKELLRQSKSQTLIMPKIKALSHWSQTRDTDLKILAPLQRHLLLANLLQDKTPYLWQECLALSTSLMKLLDEFYIEEISFEKLATLVPENLSHHWQGSLTILNILFHEWPQRLKSLGLIESLIARHQALSEQCKFWHEYPPQHTIIAAGIIGSVPQVGRFLKSILHLPQSEIIFMGLDLEMSEGQWQTMPSYHPQFGHRQTLERIICTRDQIQTLSDFSQNDLLKDQQTTFFKDLFNLEGLQKFSQAENFEMPILKNIQLIEPLSLQEEARLIALMIRQGLDQHTGDIALVTPHRGLCDRVTAELRRWQIIPNDSYGRTLYESPEGSFLALILNVVFQPLNTVAILSLLKHPLTRLGRLPFNCRRLTRLLEIKNFRTLTPFEKFDVQKIDDPELYDFYKSFQSALLPLNQNLLRLEQWVDRHLKTFELLTQNPDESAQDMILRPMGREITELFDHFKKFSSQQLFNFAEYSSLLTTHLRSLRLTQNYGMHPRVHFLGILEARLLRFDLLILGSMNDIHWSHNATQDPWMSYDMKQRLGIPDTCYYNGLIAENWLGLMHSSNIILTRSQREAGASVLESRWLLRLKALLKSQNLLSHLNPELPWQKWSQDLDRSLLKDELGAPSSSLKIPVPCPPVALRPRQLSVTEVQLWLQDPYALYAKKILKLAPLPLLEKEITPALFGIVVHRALEEYVSSTPAYKTRDRLLHYGRQGFGPLYDNLLIQNLWWPRFIRLCDWFLEVEQKRASNIYKSWTELKGHLMINAPAGPFMLRAKADRIDLYKDRSHEIIDYKTGTLPSRKEVTQGTAVQLPLEGAISLHGTWERMSTSLTLSGLSFWQLKGSMPAGDIVTFSEATLLSEEVFVSLCQLVAYFDLPTTAYPAHPQASNDYNPLARRQEWRTRGPL
ncbi:MAG: double-strand break repair protein AddB [Janthinobacterium lividum]